MTQINRREYMGMLGASVAGGMARGTCAAEIRGDEMFSFPKGTVYLNAARLHPLSAKSVERVQAFLKVRRLDPVPDVPYFTAIETKVRESLAKLVNARPEEISYTPGAQAAENFVVSGLGLEKVKDGIVTDALHYRGSLYLYGEMAKRGFDVKVVRPRENRIRLEDIAAAMDGRTSLVAVSLVSYVNGFQHDLKALCELAHAKGALVVADVAQAAGAVPIDVRASGVDFLAFAGHKWFDGRSWRGRALCKIWASGYAGEADRVGVRSDGVFCGPLVCG